MTGTWTDITAVGLGAAGFLMGALSWWQSKRSADAAVISARAADRSAAAAELSAAAEADSAATARQALALDDQRLELEHPTVDLEKILFRLRNAGHKPVAGVRVSWPDLPDPGLARMLPDGIRLEPGESSPGFQLIATGQVGLPPQLRVECDGIDEPLFLMVP